MSSTNKRYKDLVSDVLMFGERQEGRNGSQLIMPHASFTLDFRRDAHVISLRKMHTKGIRGEFKTLISKDELTNVKQFEANGCNYWKNWCDKDGSLTLDYYNQLHPQLEEVIEAIITTPESRRHVISLWDHDNVERGNLSLPCCWHGMTFSIIGDVLHMKWDQRSVDTMIGLPSDIYLAYLFMNHVSIATGYAIGSCLFSLSNVHIYDEHIEGAEELLLRTSADAELPLIFELKS